MLYGPVFLALVCLASAVGVSSRVFAYDFEYTPPLFAPYAPLIIGTPAQEVACVFDIGSSDTLVQREGMGDVTYLDRFNPASLPRSDPIYGSLARVTSHNLDAFNASLSESLHYNDSSKQFVWNQYQTTQGQWATEVLGLGNGIEWSTRGTCGLMYSSNTTSCVVGLGPINGEISGETFENHVVYPRYNNMVELFLETSMISTRSYSIWFNKTKQAGAIVFGGTDTRKYIGRLTSVPIVSYVSSGNQVSHLPGTVLSTRIMFHGLSVFLDPYDNSTLAELATPETAETLAPTQSTSPHVIDLAADNGDDTSGSNSSDVGSQAVDSMHRPPLLQMTTSVSIDLSTLELFTRLPRQMVDQAAVILGLQYIPKLGMYAGSCNSGGSIRLNMSSIFINIPLTDVLVSAEDVNVKGWKMSDGSPLCFLTILPEDSYSYVMGNGILQNLYTFVDLSLETVSFAPLNLTTEPDDVDIKAYEYNDRYKSMDLAPGYNCTSLSRAVSATFFTTGVVTNGTASVVVNAAGSAKHAFPFSAMFYLFFYFI